MSERKAQPTSEGIATLARETDRLLDCEPHDLMRCVAWIVDAKKHISALASVAQERETEIARLQSKLDSWRGWAQFVYLGGGPLRSEDDRELRRLVCEANDVRWLAQEAEIEGLINSHMKHDAQFETSCRADERRKTLEEVAQLWAITTNALEFEAKLVLLRDLPLGEAR